MEDKKKYEEKLNNDYLLYRKEINGKEDIESFVRHIEWWRQLAGDNGKKLVFQAHLIS